MDFQENTTNNGGGSYVAQPSTIGTGEMIDTCKMLQNLALDLKRLSEARPPDPSADVSAPFTIISAGSSYTRLWTANTWKIHSGPPLSRYIRHVRKWHSSTTAQQILPTVIAASAWAVLLSLTAKSNGILGTLIKFCGPSSVLSSLSAPLALLLTLRTNASMSRLVEARLLWGRLIHHSRSLASLIKTHLFPLSPAGSILMARHISVLGWVLKAAVRGESEDVEFDALRIILGDGDEYQWLISQPKRSIALLTRIRQLTAHAIKQKTIEESSPNTAASILLLVEERILELDQCIGGCERLYTSPIPPTYSRHLSRVMSLWILLTPMSLIAMGLSTVGVFLATSVATYVLVGIDEVGMEIENAFRLLPLQQLSGAIQNSVRDQFLPVGDMPPPI